MEQHQYLINAIKKEYERVAAEEIENCTKRIRERMAEITSGVVLNLMRHVQVDSLRDRIVIEVRLPKESQ